MADYPAQHEADLVLKDGSTLRFRPIRPEDADGLLLMYHRLSHESLYFRFFSVPKPEPHAIRYLANVDYVDHFALVAETHGDIVAVGRYSRSKEDPRRAEAAFVTIDALQGKGIGTLLLERLAAVALENGIDVFDAEVLAENHKMLDVFVGSGFEVERRLDGNAYHLSLLLSPTAALSGRIEERHRRAAAASMRLFFEPASVAVVGASRKVGSIGYMAFKNLKDTGYTGTLYAVNPAGEDIEGTRAYRALDEIPGPVDLAILTVPAAHVEEVVDGCIEKGVKALVVITAGFGEVGPEGRRREAALLEKVRRAGVRMIGPNCMGILNTDPKVCLNATFVPAWPPRGRIAMSTQSGALGYVILDYARSLNLGFSTFVSVGNKADVSGNDLIQYWSEDPSTDVILLYLESFGNPRKFGQLARSIGRRKPIVAVKSGRGHAGARAASSHTGALASDDAVVDALFRQAGIVRTQTLQELFDTANLFAHQPIPRGRRVAVLTNAGGPAILAADACEAHGLTLPALSEHTVTALRSFLPEAASVSNPVDMIASARPEHYRKAMELLLADPLVDSLIVIFIPPLLTVAEPTARAIVEGAQTSQFKPVLANFMSSHGVPPILSGIPCYPFPESAAAALARVTQYGEWRGRPEGNVPTFPDIQETEIRELVAQVLARGGGWMRPAEVQRLLQAAGIPVARACFCGGADEAAEAAASLGFPVALKAAGPTIVHKSDVGGIRLDLPDEAAVRAAYAELEQKLGAELTGATVQEMVAGGVETVVGAVLDATFGPLVVFGSGGVLVELLADVAFRLHPLTDADAAAMLEEVKATKLLRGFRGHPPADEAAVRDVILRVSALLTLCPEIHEMDVNPLKALPGGVRAVDARVRIDRRPVPPRSRRISY